MNYQILSRIKSPADVKKLSAAQLEELASEIRRCLVDTVSKNGGHLASNLGVVELTIALHRCFNSPKDRIIFDVGHQSYVHKLLTGRLDRFETLRQGGGLSGFTRPYESEHDVFFSGHSSTALSAAYGIAAANAVKGSKDYTVAVVGDGAFTGGEVYEAMNNAGRKNVRLIVVLNDNEMSISPNVGALAKYLAVIKADPRYFRLKAKTEETINSIPLVGTKISKGIFDVKTRLKNRMYNSTMFEELGFRYIGPIDGHDIQQLSRALEAAKEIKHYPVLVHVNTVKGKGYEYAERFPCAFHGVSEFDAETGDTGVSGKSFSSEFGQVLVSLAAGDRRICAVTAAMASGTGLEEFEKRFPNRFFDVGIAEQHAVTFCSGLAAGGMLPVFAVYSTFLQRGYDQIIHDCALQGLKVVFSVDRAGFVGSDGETHQGLYDAAFLGTIPNITVYSPSTYAEEHEFLRKAIYDDNGTVAVRIPRGSEKDIPEDFRPGFGTFDVYPRGEVGSAPAADMPAAFIVTYGRLFPTACAARQKLTREGLDVGILKLNRIKPIDPGAVDVLMNAEKVFFFEEGQQYGGVGERLLDMLASSGFSGSYINRGVDDCFVPQEAPARQLAMFGLDADGMVSAVLSAYKTSGDKNG
ncbi:MAG: 1-deoxy-D-xylulose-5-phosphate synthase [Clostridia bacterium]|nr:1-deoxy-D-xylulose-5-phosphate synthase [Clostridia bacterium]